MNDIEQLKQAKDRCIADISDALVNYSGRLNSIDERLMIYIEDALSGHASHSNLYELLGIRKVFRLMSSYDLDGERVQRTLRAIEGVWENGRHQKAWSKREQRHMPRMMTTDDKPSAMMLASMAEVRRRKTDRSMPSGTRLARQGKAAIKREQSQAGLMIAEREQARPKVKGGLKFDTTTNFASKREQCQIAFEHCRIEDYSKDPEKQRKIDETIKKCANLAEGIVYEHIGKDYFAIMKEYGEIPVTIMQAALIATADMILERDPKENYAFKMILKPYKKKK